jgi:hypothetical protein
LVAFLDDLVARGQASSRAMAVTEAVERKRRQEIAAQGAAVLAQSQTEADDLGGLAEFAARTPMNDLG